MFWLTKTTSHTADFLKIKKIKNKNTKEVNKFEKKTRIENSTLEKLKIVDFASEKLKPK